MPLTFKDDSVLPKELENKTGNLSQMIFRDNEKGLKDVKPLAPLLEQSNPYDWNMITTQSKEDGYDNRFQAYMKQARMSTYYQDNPWEVLQFSGKHGYQGPQMGGQIRGNIPPGHMPGNTLTKPNKDIRMQMSNRNNIEGFGNVQFGSSVNWN